MIDPLEAIAVAEVLERTIPVAEIFGPTLEGEGPWAGTPTYFLRIGGCDFKCEWCDTDHAVLVEKVRGLERFTQAQIWDKLYDYTVEHPGPDLLAISGGNPGLYDLSRVVENWQSHDRSANGHDANGGYWPKRVLVETQGSRWQPWFRDVSLLTVSPKAPSSGMTNGGLDGFMANVEEAADYWYRFFEDQQSDLTINDRWRMIFKVVVFDERDYEFAKALHLMYPDIDFYLSTGTAMGGLSGKWVPPAIPEIEGLEHYDPFETKRNHPSMQWALPAVDSKEHLLRRYRWLAERAMNDSAMADVTVGVQLHCLLWGVTTRGV